jgi:HEAT repeat protein
MLREIALTLGCIVTFALATGYVGYSARVRSDRDGQRIAKLESEITSLQERLALLGELLGGAGSGAGVPSAPVDRSPDLRTTDAGARPGALARSAVGDMKLARAIEQIAPDRDPEVRREAARSLLHASGEELRLHAVRTLLSVDFSAGLEAISELLEQSDRRPEQVRTALGSLSVLGEVEGAEADSALRMFAASRSSLVRVQAGKVLARRGDSEPIAKISRQLVPQLASPDHRVRLQTLALLGVAAQRETIAQIVPLLRDPNSEIRYRAIRTLGEFADPSLRGEMTRLLADPVPQIRRTAATALRGLR